MGDFLSLPEARSPPHQADPPEAGKGPARSKEGARRPLTILGKPLCRKLSLGPNQLLKSLRDFHVLQLKRSKPEREGERFHIFLDSGYII